MGESKMITTAQLPYQSRCFVPHNTKKIAASIISSILCFSLMLTPVSAVRTSHAMLSGSLNSLQVGTGIQPPIARILVQPATQGVLYQVFTFDGSTSTPGYTTHAPGTLDAVASSRSTAQQILSHEQHMVALAHEIVSIQNIDNACAEKKLDTTVSDETTSLPKTQPCTEPSTKSTLYVNAFEQPDDGDTRHDQQSSITFEDMTNGGYEDTVPPLLDSPAEECMLSANPGEPESIPASQHSSDEQEQNTLCGEENQIQNEPSPPQPAYLYHWDFGDGTTANGMIVTHAYLEYGQYTVVLTFTDAQGSTDTDTVVMTITPNKPTLHGAFTEQGYTLFWEEIPGTNVYYNIYKDSRSWGYTSGCEYRISPLDAGMYQISAVAQLPGINLEGEKSDGILVSLLTRFFPPVALISESSGFGFQGKPICFDGSESYSPNGDITRYIWSFGDGTIGFGETLYHTYTKKGNYTVTLTITDAYNQTDTTSIQVIVVKPNHLPCAIIYTPLMHATVGENITFDGSLSYDPDGTITAWMWDFGDGSQASGEKIMHRYTTPGNYTVTLTVTDNDKSVASNTTRIIVAPYTDETNKPKVSIKNTQPGSYILTIQSPFDEGHVCYVIDWGVEGQNPKKTPFFDAATQVSASHTYSKSGSYRITVIAYDENQQQSLPADFVVTVELEEKQLLHNSQEMNTNTRELMQSTVSLSVILVFGIAVLATVLLAWLRRKKNI